MWRLVPSDALRWSTSFLPHPGSREQRAFSASYVATQRSIPGSLALEGWSSAGLDADLRENRFDQERDERDELLVRKHVRNDRLVCSAGSVRL